MTPELIAILSAALGLAVFGLAGFRYLSKQLDTRIDRLEEQQGERFDRIEARLDRIEERQSALEQRVARLEGLLDGLREALFARAPN